MVFVLCGSLKMHVETSLLRECHRAGPCMVSYGPTGQRVQFPSTNAADKACDTVRDEGEVVGRFQFYGQLKQV